HSDDKRRHDRGDDADGSQSGAGWGTGCAARPRCYRRSHCCHDGNSLCPSIRLFAGAGPHWAATCQPDSPKSIMNLFAKVGLLAVTAGAWLGCKQEVETGNASAEAPVEVRAVHPHRGEIFRYIDLPGEVHPLFTATMFAKVDGYLRTLKVDKGDPVKEGD